MDLGAIGQDALKESGYITHLRNVDAIAHVVRAFEDDSIPHAGPIDPLRDIKNVEFDLMVSDLGQIEKRIERVEKDLKKMRTADLEKEFELLKRAKGQIEAERPLREMEMTPGMKMPARQVPSGVGASPAGNGDDAGGQKTLSRLYVPE